MFINFTINRSQCKGIAYDRQNIIHLGLLYNVSIWSSILMSRKIGKLTLSSSNFFLLLFFIQSYTRAHTQTKKKTKQNRQNNSFYFSAMNSPLLGAQRQVQFVKKPDRGERLVSYLLLFFFGFLFFPFSFSHNY